MHSNGTKLACVEICAGGGGQALGLELAGFDHAALVDQDNHCCSTLQHNRPDWNVIKTDIAEFDGTPFKGVDLLAGGLPCPPFSVAGKQLGQSDERNLFPHALRLVDEIRPRAVLIENVRGLLSSTFEDYRSQIDKQFMKLGYKTDWKLLNAADFGVSQTRYRVALVAIKKELWNAYQWPAPALTIPPTVGEILWDLMAGDEWKGVDAWRKQANAIAPTIVGGSLKHGGPDLGPTRAKRAWAALSVDGHGIADNPPDKNFSGKPRLTVRMVARLQGFPDSWMFSGKKTAAYRQVGNAFPPQMAMAVAKQIHSCLVGSTKKIPVCI